MFSLYRETQMRDGEQLNFSPDFAKTRSLCSRSICSPISFFCCCVFWSKLTFRDKNEIKKRRKIFDEREKGFLSICFYLFCVRSFISMKIKWEVHFPGKKFSLRFEISQTTWNQVSKGQTKNPALVIFYLTGHVT